MARGSISVYMLVSPTKWLATQIVQNPIRALDIASGASLQERLLVQQNVNAFFIHHQDRVRLVTILSTPKHLRKLQIMLLQTIVTMQTKAVLVMNVTLKTKVSIPKFFSKHLADVVTLINDCSFLNVSER